MENLAIRVAALERSAKRWKLVSFVAFVGLVGMGAADPFAKVPEAIVAKRFVVVDNSGTEIAFMGSDILDGVQYPVVSLIHYKKERGTTMLAGQDLILHGKK